MAKEHEPTFESDIACVLAHLGTDTASDCDCDNAHVRIRAHNDYLHGRRKDSPYKAAKSAK